MKKLTVALVLVALLILPIVGLADPPANPPQGNEGLRKALIHNCDPIGWGWSVIWWLFFNGAPGPYAKN